MDNQMASDAIKAMQVEKFEIGESIWRNPCHIATNTYRTDALKGFDPDGDEFLGRALIEILLTQPLIQEFDEFYAIIKIDKFGVWYMDADGHEDDAAWRPTLIPWTQIRAIRMHQVS
jgi:hypothetical protein